MSDEKHKIRDASGNVYKLESWKVVETIENMVVVSFLKGRVSLDETCDIRQRGSEWYPLTESFCEAIIKARGDVDKARTLAEEELQRQKETKEQKQREEAEAKIQKQQLKKDTQNQLVQEINNLVIKCQNGEWSLADLQYIYQYTSNIPSIPDANPENAELSKAHSALINQVSNNPSITEQLKIMYANAQLEMQHRILSALNKSSKSYSEDRALQLERLESQRETNAILKQNQKSGNQKAAAGMLGGIVALNQLGDISDSLGGDE